ncbi:ADP-ribosylation factor-like protein 6-interacting protein 4 [Culicoides brevitarsis]|uniref:ADP-ribosylation factor-like protein 6-interacting protein 4 n=1 Tax=Culicoides brevitarsis TaxID=469753 RepID=UPI00307BB92F
MDVVSTQKLSEKVNKKSKKSEKKKKRKRSHSSSSSDSSSYKSSKKKSKKSKKKKKNKHSKKETSKDAPKNTKSESEEEEDYGIPLDLMNTKAKAPESREEYEKRQSVVRKVYDEETGRHRLIKGDGEVIEEIVSKSRHDEINKAATQSDGSTFQNKLGLSKSDPNKK